MSNQYCPHCGAKLTPGYKYCEQCGANVETDVRTENDYYGDELLQPAVPRKKSSKMVPLIIAIVIAVIIVAGIAGFFIWSTKIKTTEVDLTSRIPQSAITFLGENGEGTAQIDEVKARNAIEAGDKKAKKFIEGVSYTIDKDTNLSNGDEITVTADYSATDQETYRIEPKNTSRKFVVKGLKTTETQRIVIDYNDKGLYDYSLNNEVYSYDDYYLAESDVSGWSHDKLQRAINDICAMNGRKFDSKEIQSYYNRFSWYTPMHSPDDFDSHLQSYLTDTEYYNYNLLAKVRDR